MSVSYSNDSGAGSIDLTLRDFIPFIGTRNYAARNKRFTDSDMSDFQEGHQIDTSFNKIILLGYNTAVGIGLAVGFVSGLEKILS